MYQITNMVSNSYSPVRPVHEEIENPPVATELPDGYDVYSFFDSNSDNKIFAIRMPDDKTYLVVILNRYLPREPRFLNYDVGITVKVDHPRPQFAPIRLIIDTIDCFLITRYQLSACIQLGDETAFVRVRIYAIPPQLGFLFMKQPVHLSMIEAVLLSTGLQFKRVKRWLAELTKYGSREEKYILGPMMLVESTRLGVNIEEVVKSIVTEALLEEVVKTVLDAFALAGWLLTDANIYIATRLQ